MSVESSEEAFEPANSQLWRDVDQLIEDGRSERDTWEDIRLLDMLALPKSELSVEFASMLGEAQALPYGGKHLRGPRYKQIEDILQATSEMLQERQYTPEYLFFPDYMSQDVAENYWKLNSSEKDWLGYAHRTHNNALERLAGDEFHDRDDTTVWFDAPPFRYQGEHSRYKASQNCLNACYRMVYEAVTGETIPEGSVTRAVFELVDSHLIDDETLLNTFFTESFQNRHQKQVNIWSITGASIKNLASYKERILQKLPHKQVYAIVDLQSQSSSDIWHTNILIGANKDMVVCHDPREAKPIAFRQLSRESFERRWVKAYNRAHLIIADPLQD